jgi:hypothetical protein
MTSAVPARNGGPGRRSPRTSQATPPDTRMETAVAKPCNEDAEDPELPLTVPDPELPFTVPDPEAQLLSPFRPTSFLVTIYLYHEIDFKNVEKIYRTRP